jgi:hypothetical protein
MSFQKSLVRFHDSTLTFLRANVNAVPRIPIGLDFSVPAAVCHNPVKRFELIAATDCLVEEWPQFRSAGSNRPCRTDN